MSARNKWVVEGFIGKYPKEGQGRNGPWMAHSIAVYAGKDKETDKSKYVYVGFFVPKDDIPTFKRMESGTILRLTGRPEASSYIDKSGELVQKINIQLDWEGGWEVVERQKQEVLPVDEDEPF